MQSKEIMSEFNGKKTKITVNQEENIDNVALLVKENKLKQITVVDPANRAVGTITQQNLIDHSDDLNEDFFLN